MGNVPFNVNQCQNLISQMFTGTQSTVASPNNSIPFLQTPHIQQNKKNYFNPILNPGNNFLSPTVMVV